MKVEFRKKGIFFAVVLTMLLFLECVSVSADENASQNVRAQDMVKVTFLGQTGNTNRYFEARNKTVKEGTVMKLPSLPSVTGYQSLGWSARRRATTASYKVGQSVMIRRNVTLYAVYKKVGTYSVTFNNNSGTSTSPAYSSLNTKVTKNGYLTLPELSDLPGYRNLGWTTTLKGTTPLYKVGTRFKVTADTKFYAVRKKVTACTVNFYSNGGHTNAYFQALQEKVWSGSYLTFPSVPGRNGYVGIGWTTKKYGTSAEYKTGSKCRISGNQKFYAVYKKGIAVTLCRQNGSVWRTYSVEPGGSFTLPGVANPTGYTMLGWSSTAGQSTNPSYGVGQTINNIRKNVRLYMVMFDRNREPDLTNSTITKPNTEKYGKIILVGDSRTVHLKYVLKTMSSGVTNRVAVVAKGGEGLLWFQNEGKQQLMSEVGNGSDGKKTAVVFNLGINDMKNIHNYVTYMQKLGRELKKKGCELFYMSLNPANNTTSIQNGGGNRPEATIRKFNSIIKRDLCTGAQALYKYLNVYSYLIKNGYGTDKGANGIDIGFDDGIHYTVKTYKRIYDQIMRRI